MKVVLDICLSHEEATVTIKSGILYHSKKIVTGKKALRQDGVLRSGKTDYIAIMKRILAVIKKTKKFHPYIRVERALITEKNVFTPAVYFWYYTIVFPMMPMMCVYRSPDMLCLVHAKIEFYVNPIKGGYELWKILRKFSTN